MRILEQRCFLFQRSVIVALLLAHSIPASASPAPEVYFRDSAQKSSHFGTNILPVRFSAFGFASADAGNDIDDLKPHTQDPAESAFSAGDTASAFDEGDWGTAVGETVFTASAVLDTAEDTLSVSFDANSHSSATNTSEDDEAPFGESSGQFYVDFVVDSSPVAAEINGTMSVSTGAAPAYGQVRVEIIALGAAGEPPYRQVIMATGGSDSANVNGSVVLEPGRYQLRLRTDTESYFDEDDELGSVFAQSVLSVDVVLTSADPGIYFWEGLNGDFDDEMNWEPEGVPGSGDTAVFDKDQTYFVDFGGEESSRVLVERGHVHFAGGNYAVGGGSVDAPSLVVGNAAAGNASLTLIAGHGLETDFATLGRSADTNGQAALVSDAAPSIWDNQGRLVVAGDGVGTLTLFENGRVSTAELIIGQGANAEGAVEAASNGSEAVPSLVADAAAIGLHGLGEFHVRNDAIRTDTLVLGVEPGGEGYGTLERTAQGGAASWGVEHFTAGDQGFGSLWIGPGGRFAASGSEGSVIANAPGSEGEVTIAGCDAELLVEAPHLTVGNGGQGFLDVLDGGVLEVAGSLVLGFEEGSAGAVTVSGSCSAESPSALLVTQGTDLGTLVGLNGTGALSILDGAEGFTGDTTIGAFEGSQGLAAVDSAEWVIIGALILALSADSTGTLILSNGATVSCGGLTAGENGGIFGSGTLEVPAGPGNSVEGTIGTGVWVQTPPAAKAIKQGEPMAERLRGHGTLVIEGDIEMTGGVLDLSIGGLTANVQDKLIVNGNLNLDAVTILIRYANHYGPKAGDTAEILEVTGALQATNLTLLYAGLADGFDYQVNIEDGVLEVEALTDGIPTSPPPTDLNLDGAVNAVDVQLVINGALGILGVAQTDVDFDGNTNAIDVQLVINAALGL